MAALPLARSRIPPATQASPFRVWYFNYAILTQGDLRHQYGISGGELQTSVFAFRT